MLLSKFIAFRAVSKLETPRTYTPSGPFPSLSVPSSSFGNLETSWQSAAFLVSNLQQFDNKAFWFQNQVSWFLRAFSHNPWFAEESPETLKIYFQEERSSVAFQ
jgi:hypothetical protein